MKKIEYKNLWNKVGAYIIISTLIISFIATQGIATSSSGKGANIILYEGFEGGIIPPTGWTHIQHNVNETWQINESSYSGNYCAMCSYDEYFTDIQDEWLITPPLNFTGYRAIYLSFWWSHSYYWGVEPYDNYDLNVLISLDNGDSWLLLWNESVVGNFTSYKWYDTTFGVHIDLSEFYDETDVLIGFQYFGIDGSATYLDDIIIGPTGKSDIHCEGDLNWDNIIPNSQIFSNFTVQNLGDPGSLLNWEIVEYPEWGNWNFTLDHGYNLTPEDEATVIDFIVKVPPQQNEEFYGNITVVNEDNRTDFCTIPVALNTTTSTVNIAIILGRISNMNDSDGSISLYADSLFCIQSNPFGIHHYSNNEKIVVSNDYIGRIKYPWVFGLFNLLMVG